MPSFRGKVLKNRQVVFDEVEGEYVIQMDGPPATWSGYFTVPKGVYPQIGKFDLQMDSGRTVPIIVNRMVIDPTQEQDVDFVGAGPTP